MRARQPEAGDFNTTPYVVKSADAIIVTLDRTRQFPE
jgi:hypothetical protein